MLSAPGARSTRPRSRLARRLLGGLAAVVLALAPAILTATPAHAATATATITPAAATAQSNVPVTFTLSITCNGPGTCDGLQAAFPSNAVTGNGANTDLSTWIGVSSCPGVTRTVTASAVVFTYPTFSPGTQACNFPVRAPEYTTLNGAQATLTPTISGPGLPSFTGAPATLTVTAGHNVSMGAGATARVLPGATTTFSISLICGGNREYTGDIGLSSLHMEATLPANFVFASFTPRNAMPGTFTAPAAGSSGGILSYDDPTGASCGNPPLTVDNAIVVTIQGTITGGVGTQSCVSGTATFTYLDRTTPDTASSSNACTLVVDLQTQITKSRTTRSMGNAGQYLFGGNTYPYTFPGDWDQSAASMFYELRVSTVPTSTSSGLSYLITDPLPCMDTSPGNVYASNPVGTLCANPAFIPNRLVVTSGFTPAAGDVIRLHRADGTVTEVAFAAGGWTIPTTGSPVSEIEIPAFPAEGANSVGAITFRVTGYASPAAQPGRLMRNTATSQPYLSGTTDTLGTPQTSVADVLIADLGDGPADTGRTIIRPGLVGTMTGTCTATIGLRNNTGRVTYLEITKAPSEAIYIDYLAPAGATPTTSTTITAQLAGVTNGRTYSTGAMAATTVADFNGTGRTLYRWVVPAGTVLVPGLYQITGFNLGIDLGAGCAGTFPNDVTIGYGAPLTSCIFNNFVSETASVPPLNPLDNTALQTNASPIADNYCGYSAPLTVAAINPGFSIDKTVQGNLDAAPAPGGTTGKVGTNGGQATYTLTFTNSGQSNLDDPVLYDLLPRLGDTEASSTASRDSQFAVELLAVGALPADVTVQYSTAANPCRPEVLAVNPGCTNDWTATAPSPLSTATALRFAYSGALSVPGGGTSSFSVSFDVTTPASIDGRIAWNSAGANADAGGSPVGAAESTRVGLEADGQPTIVKTASQPTYDAAGDTVTFSYLVSNAAGVPVSGVSVTDQFTDAASGSSAGVVTCVTLSNPAGPCSGATTDLLPGQQATFSMTYTIVQADLDHGLITDEATVTAQPALGPPLSNTSDPVTVTAVQSPALTLDKNVAPTTVSAAGAVVGYTFDVTNSGNVTLTSIDITELAFGGTGGTPLASCPAIVLAPGVSTTCTASYTITQDDMDAGSVVNTAVAAAEFGGAGVLSPASTATVTALQDPSLALVKSADLSSVGSAGQMITYSFLVTNDGNVTIDGIDVQELSFSGAGTAPVIACPGTMLAPFDDMTCTATYTVTQVDIDSGAIDNIAQVTGDDPAGAQIPTPPTSGVTVPVVYAPALTLIKTADRTHVTTPGTVISYSFEVINNGNTTLTGLAVTETAFSGAGAMGAITCPVATLAPTDRTTCTADYSVVAGDAGSRRITNTAEASAAYNRAGAAVTVTSAASTAVVAVDPALGLAATGSDVPAQALGVAIIALALGALLVAVGRRRRAA